jgi:hypothetical protein
MVISHTRFITLLLLVCWATYVNTTHAQSITAPRVLDRDCSQWTAKKGYAHDYVEQRIGFRPPARNDWSNNLHRDELDAGDVVVLTALPGHVALVDEVDRDGSGAIKRLKVSDFNYRGKGSEAWQDKGCEVTTNFGKEQTRWIALKEVSGQWRAPRARRY